jgi:hypothetical protein
MKLKKLKMPAKAEISTAELDMGEMPEGGMDEEMTGESEGEMGEAPEAPESSMLADASDDELLAELKKRGLMGQLSEESPKEKARDKSYGAKEMEPEEEEYMV